MQLFLCLCQARLAGGGIVFWTCPFVQSSVRSFIYYHTYEHDLLKTEEQILVSVGISSP